jgi:hypothetical protein
VDLALRETATNEKPESSEEDSEKAP